MPLDEGGAPGDAGKRAALCFGILIPALVGGLYLVPRAFALRLLGEGGAFEIAELALYALAALLAVRAPGLHTRAKGWIVLVLAILAASEINPGGVFESLMDRPPAHGGDPVGLRLGGAVVLAVLLGGAMLGLFLAGGRGYLAALRGRRPEAWLVLVGVALIPCAILLDRYHDSHLVWNRGYRLGIGVSFATHLAEELAESITPAFFLAALLVRRPPRGSSPTSRSSSP